MVLAVVAFVVGVYIGKAHYDQFVALVKAGWAKITGFFKKKDDTTK